MHELPRPLRGAAAPRSRDPLPRAGHALVCDEPRFPPTVGAPLRRPDDLTRWEGGDRDCRRRARSDRSFRTASRSPSGCCEATAGVDRLLGHRHAGHGSRAQAEGLRYLTPELMPRFDLYLSFTGGPLLESLGAARPHAFWCLRRRRAYHRRDPTSAGTSATWVRTPPTGSLASMSCSSSLPEAARRAVRRRGAHVPAPSSSGRQTLTDSITSRPATTPLLRRAALHVEPDPSGHDCARDGPRACDCSRRRRARCRSCPTSWRPRRLLRAAPGDLDRAGRQRRRALSVEVPEDEGGDRRPGPRRCRASTRARGGRPTRAAFTEVVRAAA